MSDIATPSPVHHLGPPVVTELPPRTLPYVSFALISLLCLIFALGQSFAVDGPISLFAPSIPKLMALGGVQQLLVRGQGEWWRIFTAPLLHFSTVHLFSNSLVLLLAGWTLERSIGRLWFAAIFVIGGLGGCCGSLFFNPRYVVSAGASGAIMGLFAAMLVISFRYTDQPIRRRLQRRAFLVLIPMLLLMWGGRENHIDHAGHALGAITGGIAAFFLSELWREGDPLPGLQPTAMAIILIGALGAAYGAIRIGLKLAPPPIAAGQPSVPIPLEQPSVPIQEKQPSVPIQEEQPSVLIPEEYLPTQDSDIHDSSVWWYVSKYPGDPRSHYYKALFLLGKRDLAAAEQELQIALDQKQILETRLAPAFKVTLQASLALVLLDEQKADAAREAAAAACRDRSLAVYPKLQARGLCTSPN